MLSKINTQSKIYLVHSWHTIFTSEQNNAQINNHNISEMAFRTKSHDHLSHSFTPLPISLHPLRDIICLSCLGLSWLHPRMPSCICLSLSSPSSVFFVLSSAGWPPPPLPSWTQSPWSARPWLPGSAPSCRCGARTSGRFCCWLGASRWCRWRCSRGTWTGTEP